MQENTLHVFVVVVVVVAVTFMPVIMVVRMSVAVMRMPKRS